MSIDNGTASATERTMACPASVVLPRTHRQSRYAHRGRGLHSFVRSVLVGTPVAVALEALDEEYRDTARRIDFAKLGGDLRSVRCEVAYALDPVARRARELGVDIDRGYEQAAAKSGVPIGPNEIPGTADIEGQRVDDVEVVLDMKFGWDPVTPARENGQLLTLGACRYLVTGGRAVEHRIARVHPDGSVDVDRHTFEPIDFDMFLDAWEETLSRIRAARRVHLSGGVPEISSGPWCKHCESMPFCPEYQSLAKAMIEQTEQLAAASDERIAELTVEQVGRAYAKAEQIATLLDRVYKALDARVHQEGLVPFGNGKAAKSITVTRNTFDQKSALELLRAKGATDAEIASLYVETVAAQVRVVNDPAFAKRTKSRAA